MNRETRGAPPRSGPWTVVALLALSAAAIAAAPRLMGPGYSWVSNAISESAAQGQEGAWLARLGFLFFGFAVLQLAAMRRVHWGLAGTLLLGTFGVFMVSTAAFSHKPWRPGVPFDPFEDLLHSVTASGMGAAFALGVTSVAIRGARASLPVRPFDWVAVMASVVIPMTMMNRPDIAGLTQRAMFGIAYVWYASEALRPRQPPAGGGSLRAPGESG